MKSFACLLVLAATTFVAEGRLIMSRTFRELDKSADIIVVGRPVSTKETSEQSDLPHVTPAIHAVGLSSEFEVNFVLKGDSDLKKLVVHHYRLADPNQMMMDAPMLVSFDPKESTRYLLFLQRESDGRYAPFNQTDPAFSSIRKLDGPKWNEMKSDDFKEWWDAMKWLNPQPIPWDLSPEITPLGRGEKNLHEAAFNGKLEKARALIKSNPELVNDHSSYANQAPLHLAVEFGHNDVAELLLANQADVEAKAYFGWTPLLQAVFGGHKESVELLLAHNANVNVKDAAGRTPLIVAAENGYTEIAALLLAHKAELNVRNNDGLTPLHVAASRGSKDFVELLLAHHADVNAKDNKGRTPADFALLHSRQDLADLLRKHG
jgi:cytohesin